MSERDFVTTCIFIVISLPSSIMDIKKFRIPVFYVLFGILLFFSLTMFYFFNEETKSFSYFYSPVAALVSSFLVYFGARIFSGGGLGKGDIIFGLFTALYCGFYTNLIATVFAALIGILFYLAQKVIQNHRKEDCILRPIFAIPFVPFISVGAILAKFIFFL